MLLRSESSDRKLIVRDKIVIKLLKNCIDFDSSIKSQSQCKISTTQQRLFLRYFLKHFQNVGEEDSLHVASPASS